MASGFPICWSKSATQSSAANCCWTIDKISVDTYWILKPTTIFVYSDFLKLRAFVSSVRLTRPHNDILGKKMKSYLANNRTQNKNLVVTMCSIFNSKHCVEFPIIICSNFCPTRHEPMNCMKECCHNIREQALSPAGATDLVLSRQM